VSALRADFERDPDRLGALASEWNALCDAAGDARPCDTPAWHAAWRAIFGARGPCGVVCFREGGDLVGVLPLAWHRARRGPRLVIRQDVAAEDVRWLDPPPRLAWFPVRQLAPATSLESATLHGRLLARPDATAACWSALPAALAARPDWDVTVLCVQSAEGVALAGACRAERLPLLLRPRWSATYELALVAWETYARSRSRQFRKRMSGAWARAESLAALRVEVHAGADARRGLTELVAVAARSWKRAGTAAGRGVLPVTPRTQAFFERLCGAPDLEPAVVVIADGASPLGAMLVLRRGDALFGCLTCYAEEAAPLSLGRLLMQRTCEWAYARGARRFDLNGATPFSAYFGERRVDYSLALVFGRGAWARVLYAGARRLPDASAALDANRTDSA
jgi:CelD/BcsL family acetyltransferase involved in cellulose biosynthesis